MIRFDALLAVHPPRGGEIQLERIRDLLTSLRRLGLPLRWVTADGAHSADTLQILQARGFLVGLESPDRLPQHAMQVAKRALYDGRIEAPAHDLCLKEALGLERDPKTGRIDHSPGNSKDVFDAMACVILHLSMQAEVWMQHGMDPNQVPESLAAASSPDRKKAVEGRM